MIWNTIEYIFYFFYAILYMNKINRISEKIIKETFVKHLGIILPDTLLDFIGNQLSLCDLMSTTCTCKTINKALKVQCSHRLKKQYNDVISYFPLHVIGSVPLCVLLDLEWVDFQPQWIGSTGYIDNVRPSDIYGHPFKCCIDSYGRLAILMRRKTDVAVLFQRYTDSSTTWAFASASLPIGGCRLTDSMVAKLALWLAHDYADFKNY